MLRSELKPGDLFMYDGLDDDDEAHGNLFEVTSGGGDDDGEDPNFDQPVILIAHGQGASLNACGVTSDALAPNHYKRLTPEPFDVVDAWGLDYYRATALKYIARAGHKDPAKYAEDLRKAVVYLERGAKNFEAGK